MSEIDEMYKRYDAEKIFIIPFVGQEPIIINKNKPFTAEKQIELIKFLGKTADFHYVGINFSTLGDYETIEVESVNFADGLVELMTKFYDELTQEQRQKVKEILER